MLALLPVLLFLGNLHCGDCDGSKRLHVMTALVHSMYTSLQTKAAGPGTEEEMSTGW